MAELWLTFILTLDSTIRVSTPLIFAAMAGIFSERSGIIDIGLEGKMLAGAFAAASVAYVTGSPWIALGSAIMVSCLLSLIHSFACVSYRGNQAASGLAINVLAAGLTVTLGIAWFKLSGNTPSLGPDARFPKLDLPFAASARDIPVLGPIYSELLSGHSLLVYLAFILVPIVSWILFQTRFGLRLRAVGETPAAADTAGISVTRMRYQAGLCAGLLCGMAGTYLAIAQLASFVPNMTAGKGYIALAAMIFGKWQPRLTLIACLLFGFFEALGARLQGIIIPGVGKIPSELVAAVPYLLTLIVLAGFIGKAIAPAAIGVPYVKEN